MRNTKYTTKTRRAMRGFTLLETLVAVAILSVSIAAPITVATQGLSAAFFAKDQVTAFYLSQEAVEYVRSVRDENFLSGNNWLSGLDDCIGKTCTIDMPSHTHKACSGPCESIRFNSETALYNHDEITSINTPSRYMRTALITAIGDDEASISVTITWTTGSKTHTFEIRENIYNWL